MTTVRTLMGHCSTPRSERQHRKRHPEVGVGIGPMDWEMIVSVLVHLHGLRVLHLRQKQMSIRSNEIRRGHMNVSRRLGHVHPSQCHILELVDQGIGIVGAMNSHGMGSPSRWVGKIGVIGNVGGLHFVEDDKFWIG